MPWRRKQESDTIMFVDSRASLTIDTVLLPLVADVEERAYVQFSINHGTSSADCITVTLNASHHDPMPESVANQIMQSDYVSQRSNALNCGIGRAAAAQRPQVS